MMSGIRSLTIGKGLLALGLPAALGLALAACSLEPTYHRPDSSIPAAWPTSVADTVPAAASSGAPTPTSTAVNGRALPAADIAWRQFFTDPTLRELIGIALANNRDLRVAALNVEKSQAAYRIQRGDLFPSIDATAGEQAQRVASGIKSSAGGSGGGATFRTWQVGLGFTSYELDLFGRIRSLDHVALQRYFAQIETRKSAQISLVAEVANDYLTLIADRALLTLAKDTLENQEKAFALTKQTFDAGVATALDLSQARQAVDGAKADIARFTRAVAQDENALRGVLGAPLPDRLSRPVALTAERFLEVLPAGLPSDLLARRPDIAAAEHRLIATNANIGAARAAFFPSISLTGHFGTASSQLDGLFGNGSQSWTFAPSISIPIFSGGANVANLKLAKVENQIAVAQYQQTIQTAFREVADALAARGTLVTQTTAQQQLVDDAHTSFQLSALRFRQGVDNYLAVLDAQRSFYGARQGLIDVRLSRLRNRVTLYKALGGGWNAHDVKRAKSEASAPDRLEISLSN